MLSRRKKTIVLCYVKYRLISFFYRKNGTEKLFFSFSLDLNATAFSTTAAIQINITYTIQVIHTKNHTKSTPLKKTIKTHFFVLGKYREIRMLASLLLKSDLRF